MPLMDYIQKRLGILDADCWWTKKNGNGPTAYLMLSVRQSSPPIYGNMMSCHALGWCIQRHWAPGLLDSRDWGSRAKASLFHRQIMPCHVFFCLFFHLCIESPMCLLASTFCDPNKCHLKRPKDLKPQSLCLIRVVMLHIINRPEE